MARKTNGEIEKAINTLEQLFKDRKHLEYSEEDLSDLVGMTEKTVRKHLNIIKSKVGSRTIDAITRTFLDDFDMIMVQVKKGLKKAIKEKNEQRILYLTTQLSKNWIVYANLLESFGIKQKAVENINLQADITSRSLSIQIIDDRRQIEE